MKASDLYNKLIKKGLIKSENDPESHVLTIILLEEVLEEVIEDLKDNKDDTTI